MNEYQRHAYLSVLGVENYVPRWRLPMAPEPIACVFPAYALPAQDAAQTIAPDHQKTDIEIARLNTNPVVVADVLRDLVEAKKPAPVPTAIPATVEQKTAEVVPPFALSIWRSRPGLLIIDARNTQLALPTEVLLRNILSAVYGVPCSPGDEEVLRWPLLENSAFSRTAEDARNALQVWLEVELEQRPATHVLLLGTSAARYFLSADVDYAHALWQWLELPLKVQALVAPSLVEFLQQPLLKRRLWQSLSPLLASI